MIGQPALGGDASFSAILVARHEGEADEGSQGRCSCDDVDGVHVFYFFSCIGASYRPRKNLGVAFALPETSQALRT